MYKEVIKFLDEQVKCRKKALELADFIPIGDDEQKLVEEIMLLESVKKKYLWLQEHNL